MVLPLSAGVSWVKQTVSVLMLSNYLITWYVFPPEAVVAKFATTDNLSNSLSSNIFYMTRYSWFIPLKYVVFPHPHARKLILLLYVRELHNAFYFVPCKELLSDFSDSFITMTLYLIYLLFSCNFSRYSSSACSKRFWIASSDGSWDLISFIRMLS